MSAGPVGPRDREDYAELAAIARRVQARAESGILELDPEDGQPAEGDAA